MVLRDKGLEKERKENAREKMVKAKGDRAKGMMDMAMVKADKCSLVKMKECSLR